MLVSKSPATAFLSGGRKGRGVEREHAGHADFVEAGGWNFFHLRGKITQYVPDWYFPTDDCSS